MNSLTHLLKTHLPLALCAAGGIGLSIVLMGCDNSLNVSSETLQAEKQQASSLKTKRSPRSLSFFDSTITWQERVEIVRRDLPLLSKAELNDYLDHIGSHQPTSQNEEDYWVIMNEILEVIRLENLLPQTYTNVLVGYLENPATNHMVRDYAAQHLGIWLSDQEGSSEQDQEKILLGMNALKAAFLNPLYQQETTAGTALMTLYDLSEHSSSNSTEALWEELNPQLPDALSAAPVVLKTSIINVAGLRKIESVYPQIQQNATAHPNASVRLSSIAALGLYQSKTDTALLEQIANSKTKFSYAAHSALNQFN